MMTTRPTPSTSTSPISTLQICPHLRRELTIPTAIKGATQGNEGAENTINIEVAGGLSGGVARWEWKCTRVSRGRSPHHHYHHHHASKHEYPVERSASLFHGWKEASEYDQKWKHSARCQNSTVAGEVSFRQPSSILDYRTLIQPCSIPPSPRHLSSLETRNPARHPSSTSLLDIPPSTPPSDIPPISSIDISSTPRQLFNPRHPSSDTPLLDATPDIPLPQLSPISPRQSSTLNTKNS
jgi:hypothetical protein